MVLYKLKYNTKRCYRIFITSYLHHSSIEQAMNEYEMGSQCISVHRVRFSNLRLMSDDEGELEIFENQLNDNANERKIVVETADIENIERFTYLETSIRP